MPPVGKENCPGHVLNAQWTDCKTETQTRKLWRRRKKKGEEEGPSGRFKFVLFCFPIVGLDPDKGLMIGAS